MDNKLSTIIENLEKNPLFAMSLGNKELFHSNFWAWIMELEKENGKCRERTSFINFFFNVPSEQFDSKIIIEREKENRDITVTLGQESYVIENKIKSIPTEKQLKDYTEKLGRKFASGILTGVKQTLTIEESKLKTKWAFKSYKEIADFLKEYRIELDDNKYDNEYINQTIQKYSELLIITNELFDYVENNFNNQMPNNKQGFYSIIEKVKMADICKKIVCSKFEEKLKNSSRLQFKDENWIVKIKSSFSNKNAITDIFITKKVQSNEEIFIGIQIEGSQYRRVVNIPNIIPEKIFDHFKELGWAIKNYGGYSQANAQEFSNIMRAKLGWSSYGNPNYVSAVLKYYLDTSMSGSGSAGWGSPFPGKNWKTAVSSEYGYRIDPVTGAKGTFHAGIDIAYPSGTVISAVKEGTVVAANYYTTGYGYHVIIDHGGGYKTLYGHCSSLLVNVGDKVTKGQAVGKVGSTGKSTGPHLHLNVYVNGETVNPRNYIN